MEEKRGNRQIQTVIGKETSFQGTISSTENIQIDGKQEGEITTKGTIIISENGEGQGEAKITRKLEIFATGKFQGEAEMAIFIVEEGAGFHGTCQQNKK